MSPEPAPPAVDIELDGRVLVARMALHPANPLGPALLDGLRGALDAFHAERARVLVIGSGIEGFFAAGADIKHMRSLDPDGFAAYGERMRGVLEEITRLDGVAIAAVDGRALGGGLELALACDLRIGSQHARLGLPEVKLGLIPGAGGTQRLPRLIGRGRALELILTGRELDASEAHAAGLLDGTASGGATALDSARELAAGLAAGSAPAVRAAVDCVRAAGEVSLADGLRLETERIQALFADGEAREGIAAFVERRRAGFA